MSESHEVLAISKGLLDQLHTVSIAAFIKSVLKYPIVTRRLLLIRQELPAADDITKITNKAAGIVKAKAVSEGWTVFDLEGNNATKQNITNAINNQKPDFILHYGHSCNHDNVCGQQNNASVAAIGMQVGNLGLLSGLSMSTVSCYTAKNMGPAAIQAKARAYMGYVTPLTVITGPSPIVPLMQQDFIEAANAPNVALLEGATYEVALIKGTDAWDQKWQKWKTFVNPIVPSAFLNNKSGLTRLGVPKAVARPIGLVITA